MPVSERHKAESDFVWRSKDKVQSFTGCQSNSLKPLFLTSLKGLIEENTWVYSSFCVFTVCNPLSFFFLLKIHFLSPKNRIFPQRDFLYIYSPLSRFIFWAPEIPHWAFKLSKFSVKQTPRLHGDVLRPVSFCLQVNEHGKLNVTAVLLHFCCDRVNTLTFCAAHRGEPWSPKCVIMQPWVELEGKKGESWDGG